MTDMQKVDERIRSNLDQSLKELSQLCTQPSIAAQNEGMEECAQLVAQMLTKRGFNAEILPSEGHPVVVAERGGRMDRTLLFYNHYDVQPPEPLELWESPPFEPTIRDGKM